MIAAILLEVMYDIMTNQVSFNEENYAGKLSLLPDYAGNYEDEEDDEEKNYTNANIKRT